MVSGRSRPVGLGRFAPERRSGMGFVRLAPTRFCGVYFYSIVGVSETVGVDSGRERPAAFDQAVATASRACAVMIGRFKASISARASHPVRYRQNVRAWTPDTKLGSILCHPPES